ncbi:MAG: hypothetical protein JEY79_14175 [Pseudodesulfovibrio sp.]|nr:hypothetical protein [Pseudodesulfovibrio sp.]
MKEATKATSTKPAAFIQSVGNALISIFQFPLSVGASVAGCIRFISTSASYAELPTSFVNWMMGNSDPTATLAISQQDRMPGHFMRSNIENKIFGHKKSFV